jgi:hypothetical protein
MNNEYGHVPDSWDYVNDKTIDSKAAYWHTASDLKPNIHFFQISVYSKNHANNVSQMQNPI